MILGARQAYYEGATEVMKILFMYKRPPGIRTARRARPAMDQPEGAVCRLAVDSYKNAKALHSEYRFSACLVAIVSSLVPLLLHGRYLQKETRDEDYRAATDRFKIKIKLGSGCK
jgi:hypothetical protein